MSKDFRRLRGTERICDIDLAEQLGLKVPEIRTSRGVLAAFGVKKRGRIRRACRLGRTPS